MTKLNYPNHFFRRHVIAWLGCGRPMLIRLIGDKLFPAPDLIVHSKPAWSRPALQRWFAARHLFRARWPNTRNVKPIDTVDWTQLAYEEPHDRSLIARPRTAHPASSLTPSRGVGEGVEGSSG